MAVPSATRDLVPDPALEFSRPACCRIPRPQYGLPHLARASPKSPSLRAPHQFHATRFHAAPPLRAAKSHLPPVAYDCFLFSGLDAAPPLRTARPHFSSLVSH